MPLLSYLKANRKRAGVILSLICIAVGVIPLIFFTYFADPANPYSIAPVTLTSSDGTNIEALLYTPTAATGNHPGIIVGHGFTGNKRYMQPLSIELVKRGWTVISIDFHGHGSSGGYLRVDVFDPILQADMGAAMDYLLKLGNIDKIGLVGHSMGGGTAMGFAENHYGWINATVSIGMISYGTAYNFTRIPNLLMAVGQFDQLFSAETEVNFLKTYTGLPAPALNTQYGAFATNNATKVAIAPLTEHLFEPLSPVLAEQIVNWFELTFNPGSSRPPVVVTMGFNTVFFLISMAGAICLVFVLLVYVCNAIFKRGMVQPEREIIQNASPLKMVFLSVLAYGVGAALLFPLAEVFPSALPVSQGHMLFAMMVGNSAGIFVIFYLFVLRREEKHQLADIFGKMKQMSAQAPGRSFCFGIIAALLMTAAITGIMEWSTTTTILTLREYGALFSIAIIFFPFLFVKEFYFRGIQGRLAPTGRVKEYLKMVGIGCFIDNILLVPVMFLLWQNADTEVAFLALSIFVIIAFNLIQQLIVTWVYQHSARNILGSTVFYCIFYAWMIVNFFPFGLN
jgi:pimeloyl-ACP methyl ester carboxylesterase